MVQIFNVNNLCQNPVNDQHGIIATVAHNTENQHTENQRVTGYCVRQLNSEPARVEVRASLWWIEEAVCCRTDLPAGAQR
jgi:hypothetical protein